MLLYEEQIIEYYTFENIVAKGEIAHYEQIVSCRDSQWAYVSWKGLSHLYIYKVKEKHKIDTDKEHHNKFDTDKEHHRETSGITR